MPDGTDVGHVPVPWRHLGTWGRFKAEFADFKQFVRHPRLSPRLPRAPGPAWRGEWLGGLRVGRLFCWVLLLWAINLAVLGPVAATAASFAGAERRVPGMLPWFLVVVWAPIIEEMVFRYGLRRPGRALWLAPILLVGLFFGRTDMVQLGVLIAGVGTAALLAVSGQQWPWSRSRHFSLRFPLVFHGTTLAFAGLHLANFSLTGTALWLLPLMILPQWVTGLVLGWLRVRFGIGASIMLHALFNAGPMTLLWALTRWAPGLLDG